VLVATSCTPPKVFRPNVLLVSIDSLRADHVGANGYKRGTTPHLDTLGAAGAVFRTAISSSSWTLPAHVTLLTALPPAGHGVNNAHTRLDPRVVTLAEVLRANGYETAAFVGGPLLRRIYGYDKGFATYDESAVARSRPASSRGTNSPQLIQSVEKWLAGWRERGSAQPFFVFLHLWDVHYDYAPPVPYDRLFDPNYHGDVDGTDYERNRAVNPRMARRDLEHVIALYDGEIRFTDDWLGRLFEIVERMGIAADTIVVVTADHGDEFLEHRGKGHAKTLFDEVVRVPLLIRYPRRLAAGRVFDEQVRLQDVAPTILGLAEIPPPADFGAPRDLREDAGVDLTPWLVGERKPPLPELPAYCRLEPFRRLAAVRTQTHKLIASGNDERRVMSIFDLRRDAGELNRLDADGEGERLRAMLLRWEAYWARRNGPSSLPLRIDAEHEAQLRALGYLR
jgi:arylsulfatase A-like enzyme